MKANLTGGKGRARADNTDKGYASTDEVGMDTSNTNERFNPLVQLRERVKLSLSGRKSAVTSTASI